MKYFSSLFFCIFLAAGAYAQISISIPQTTTLADFRLSGNVLQMTETKYTATLISKKKKHDSLYTSKDTAFKMVQETIFIFGENGFLKEKNTNHYDLRKGKLTASEQVYYRYDSLGKIKAIIGKDQKKNTDSISFRYDLRQALTEEQHFRNQKRTLTRQYSYDLKNNLVNIREKDGENTMIGMARFSYDAKNVLTEIKYFDNMQRYLFSETFSTDTVAENHIQYNRYKLIGERSMGMKGYVMNEFGNHLEETTADSNRSVTEFKTIRYNEHQWPVEIKIFGEGEITETFTYQMDENNNWIEQNKFASAVLQSMLRREYKYAEIIPEPGKP